MTDPRIALLVVVALYAAASSAADTPAPNAAAAPSYVQAPAGSSLTITFDQAGAASNGSFRKFTTALVYDEKNLAASSLNVRMEMTSVDTQDQERNDLLKGADLFNTEKFPVATYTASSLAKRADGGIEAVGKLTIRDVTRDLRLPLSLRPTAGGFELSGKTAIKRLDYGVGQGEWKSTESVGDEVKIEYKVALVRSQSAL